MYAGAGMAPRDGANLGGALLLFIVWLLQRLWKKD
jgi:hypothetical protein